MLGFDQQVLLNHGLTKCIYGVGLISNLREYLLGIHKLPKYHASKRNAPESTDLIVEWWIERWVKRRLKRAGVFREDRGT